MTATCLFLEMKRARVGAGASARLRGGASGVFIHIHLKEVKIDGEINDIYGHTASVERLGSTASNTLCVSASDPSSVSEGGAGRSSGAA